MLGDEPKVSGLQSVSVFVVGVDNIGIGGWVAFENCTDKALNFIWNVAWRLCEEKRDCELLQRNQHNYETPM
jgi:hypothetical protein